MISTPQEGDVELTPELLDIAVHTFVVLFEPVLPFFPFSTGQELLNNRFRLCVLFWILEALQSS